jgi:hypothetical protein
MKREARSPKTRRHHIPLLAKSHLLSVHFRDEFLDRLGGGLLFRNVEVDEALITSLVADPDGKGGDQHRCISLRFTDPRSD